MKKLSCSVAIWVLALAGVSCSGTNANCNSQWAKNLGTMGGVIHARQCGITIDYGTQTTSASDPTFGYTPYGAPRDVAVIFAPETVVYGVRGTVTTDPGTRLVGIEIGVRASSEIGSDNTTYSRNHPDAHLPYRFGTHGLVGEVSVLTNKGASYYPRTIHIVGHSRLTDRLTGTLESKLREFTVTQWAVARIPSNEWVKTIEFRVAGPVVLNGHVLSDGLEISVGLVLPWCTFSARQECTQLVPDGGHFAHAGGNL